MQNKIKKVGEKMTTQQHQALNDFATRYKIPYEALEIKRVYGKNKGCIKGKVVLESHIETLQGLFEHSIIVNPVGWVKQQKTKIIA